jgi:hypothetical protein
MKITKSKIRQIIKEELTRVLIEASPAPAASAAPGGNVGPIIITFDNEEPDGDGDATRAWVNGRLVSEYDDAEGARVAKAAGKGKRGSNIQRAEDRALTQYWSQWMISAVRDSNAQWVLLQDEGWATDDWVATVGEEAAAKALQAGNVPHPASTPDKIHRWGTNDATAFEDVPVPASWMPKWLGL